MVGGFAGDIFKISYASSSISHQSYSDVGCVVWNEENIKNHLDVDLNFQFLAFFQMFL